MSHTLKHKFLLKYKFILQQLEFQITAVVFTLMHMPINQMSANIDGLIHTFNNLYVF